MSVVAVHAGTGRLVIDEDRASAKQALEVIERTSRSALEDMRRLLGVLRHEGDDSFKSVLWHAPQYGAVISVLINDSRANPYDLAELVMRTTLDAS